MDFVKYLSLLTVFFFDTTESGGHGGGSHDHIKLYVPEFHHHKHHTKYVTIHHHDKKPDKEHHHHHHHIPKPHIPHHHYGYHHTNNGHKTKITTTTISKGHKHHGPKHHGHHKHHGPKHHGHHKHEHGHHHHSHGHGHHHDDSSGYTPALSYDDSYSPLTPVVPQVPLIPHIPSIPQVHGISHTVKQVNVFDSLPGALPGNGGGKGYEVTENNDDEDDTFTAVNDIHNAYPSTYGFLKSGATGSAGDPFASLGQSQVLNAHNSFTPSHPLGGSNSFDGNVGASYGGYEGQSNSFTGPSSQGESFLGADVQSNTFPGSEGQHDPFSSRQGVELTNLEAIASGYNNGGEHESGFDSGENSFVGTGTGIGNDVHLASEGRFDVDNSPQSFTRQAGIQQFVQTGGQQTIVY